MNKHTEDQFSTCTPEEEEFFQELQARKWEEFYSKWEKDLTLNRAVEAIANVIRTHDDNGITTISRSIYAAIRDGKVPGVVLGEQHGS